MNTVWSPRVIHQPSEGSWFYFELGGPWIAGFRVEAEQGAMAVSEVTVFAADTDPDDWNPILDEVIGREPQFSLSHRIRYGPRKTPPGGLPARLMRKIRFSILTEQLQEGRESLGENFADLVLTSEQTCRLKEEPASRRGRKAYTEEFYVVLAASYVNKLKGGSRRPIQDLSEELNLSSSRVRNLIGLCRTKGLLSASPKAKAGGVLTEKAKSLLQGTLPNEA